MRVGEYRVLYDIRDRDLLVLVIRIGHRRDVYRG
jgi:mRNA interferase RelE/StbE